MATAAITKDNESFFRVCQLLMGIGTQVMRKVFANIHRPNSVDSVLRFHKKILQKLPGRILTEEMRNILFPTADSYGKLIDFDMTLLTVLFRSISGLKPPIVDINLGRRSWDEKPHKDDYSLEADLVRLKLFRNAIAHGTKTGLSSDEFANTWEAIADVLKRRDPLVEKDIDYLRNAPFTELEVKYSSDLEQWVECEKEILKRLVVHEQEVKNTLTTHSEEMKKEINELKKLIQASKFHILLSLLVFTKCKTQ